jgi:hypothetical protein
MTNYRCSRRFEHICISIATGFATPMSSLVADALPCCRKVHGITPDKRASTSNTNEVLRHSARPPAERVRATLDIGARRAWVWRATADAERSVLVTFPLGLVSMATTVSERA